MKIQVKYSEIESFISKNCNVKDLNLSYVSPQKVEVRATVKLGFLPISVSLNLEIVEMRLSSIDVKYITTSEPLKVAIRSLLVKEGIIDDLGDDKLAIRFGKMNGLSDLFKIFQLKNFELGEDNVIVEIEERE